jgi:DNA invertase Pin-like site-specific DNA recombinase
MICHSYARFSSNLQGKGDSLRRQQALAVDLCQRKGWTLSAYQYQDKGKSGFKGNKQKALDALLKAIRSGEIKRGETLIVEAIDRLSRKGTFPTHSLISTIFEAGINIQIFSPIEKFYEAAKISNDIGASIELSSFAYQAYCYSEQLSKRIAATMDQRRKRVRAGQRGESLTNRIPGWLERVDGRLVVNEEARKAIEYVFKRTSEGCGRRVLMREMNAKFKPIGTSGAWNQSALALLINGKRLRLPDGRTVLARAVCGESVSTITGEVFKPYPVVISDKAWQRAAAAASRRVRKKGPPTSRVNLLAGLLHFAGDGSHGAIFTAFQPPQKDGTRRAVRRYQSYKARNDEPGADKRTIEAEKLESMLMEFLPVLDLSAKKTDRRGDIENRIAVLEGELAGVQQTAKDRPTGAAALATVIATIAEQIEQLRGELAAIGDTSVRPTKDYRAKLAAMQRGTNEERELVRDRLLAIVSAVWVLGIKLGPADSSPVRAVVEVHFKDGEIRRGIEIDGQLFQAKSATPIRQQILDGFVFDDSWYARVSRVLAASKR